MMPRTKQQVEEIRRDRRQAILDTALGVFADLGYESASISMIARQAGISKGLMYNYFKSKEDLLMEILNIAVEKIYIHFDPNHDNVLTKEEFLFFTQRTFESLRENFTFWKLYSLMAVQPAVFHTVMPMYNSVTNKLSRLTIELFKSYGLEDAEEEYLLYTAMLKGASLIYITVPEHYPLDAIERKIINYYDNLLRK